MDFTVNGRRITLTDGDVRTAIHHLEPGNVRLHVVNVDGVEYPVKQVFAAASGLDLLDFTTNQARHVLKALGFELRRVS